jgi:hypothetical protein
MQQESEKMGVLAVKGMAVNSFLFKHTGIS